MSKKETFYITTTLPYVNSDPHVGFAMEIIRADASARLQRMFGNDVFFNTGTDEHGMKIYEKAFENGISPQEQVDTYVKSFKSLKNILNLSFDNFIRTTDKHHKESAQKFWNKCKNNGYIYKKKYKAKYCTGCELERQDSEIENGRCFIHQDRDLKIIEEENYFFRFSNFREKLLDLYKNNPDFVIPDFRLNEIRAFVERGLNDFSISRLKEKMPWGVPVPDDGEQVMYVWFDALVNYVSAIGWPDDMEKFEKYWPVVQYCGKDNLRQQSAMWQAMLFSVDLPPSRKIIINGFITSGGQKMSKSVGNVINPSTVVEEYGVDTLRYFLLREISSFEDSDFTMARLKEAYNANLANGLGNLLSRTMKMATTYGVTLNQKDIKFDINNPEYKNFREKEEGYDHQGAMDIIWERIKSLDTFIAENEPFKKIKIDELGAKTDVAFLLVGLYKVAKMLAPFMPETSEKIVFAIENSEMPEAPIFARKE